MYFLPKIHRLFRKWVALNMFTKLTQNRKGGSTNADKAGKGGRGVGEMLTMADKGGRVSLDPPPPFLADIICEQPPIYTNGEYLYLYKIGF